MYRGDSLARLGEVEPMLAAARRTTERVGRLMHDLTVEHTPVAKPPPGVALAEWIAARHGRLPATLRDSWKVGEVTVVAAGDTFVIDVYTHDRIAPFVEYPTGPHVIVSRRPGGVLRFWNKLGNTIWATIVHHPGAPGAYMLTTAIAEVAVMWQEIGREEMERWARETAAAI